MYSDNAHTSACNFIEVKEGLVAGWTDNLYYDPGYQERLLLRHMCGVQVRDVWGEQSTSSENLQNKRETGCS
jgi:hypothetical protein